VKTETRPSAEKHYTYFREVTVQQTLFLLFLIKVTLTFKGILGL
jgi:hypothetical protein